MGCRVPEELRLNRTVVFIDVGRVEVIANPSAYLVRSSATSEQNEVNTMLLAAGGLVGRRVPVV